MHLHVITTLPTQEEALSLQQAILDRKLAACVQVSGPIQSQYWWQGRLESSTEWQCAIKTTQNCFSKLEKFILTIHPYSVPEIIALPIVTGFDQYLRWLDTCMEGEKEI
jgi:periplasmic divalent cation tolerance protein